MEFDSNGNLYPYQPIEADLVLVEEMFVRGFPTSIGRPRLFGNYLAYLETLKKLIGSNFRQWIDGSFVTTKTEPGDIDAVIFVDYRIFKEKQLLHVDTALLKQEKGLDLYFVQTYPVEDSRRFRMEFDEMEWKLLFSFNRRNQPKGFIQLNA